MTLEAAYLDAAGNTGGSLPLYCRWHWRQLTFMLQVALETAYLYAAGGTRGSRREDNPVPVGTLAGDVIRARLQSVHTAAASSQGDGVADHRDTVTYVT